MICYKCGTEYDETQQKYCPACCEPCNSNHFIDDIVKQGTLRDVKIKFETPQFELDAPILKNSGVELDKTIEQQPEKQMMEEPLFELPKEPPKELPNEHNERKVESWRNTSQEIKEGEDSLDFDEPFQFMPGKLSSGQSNSSSYRGSNSPAYMKKPEEKHTKGLIIGSIVAVVIVTTIVCLLQFVWTNKGEEPKEEEHTIQVVETPTSSLPQFTPPDVEPVDPNMLSVGTINEDFILIGDQQILTSQVIVNLDNLGLENEDLEPLKYIKNLERLNLEGNHITSLEYIKDITSLKALTLTNNPISDLSEITGLVNLNYLIAKDTQVSDLSPIKGMKELKQLDIRNTEVSDLKPITALKNLEFIYVKGSKVKDLECINSMNVICDTTLEEMEAPSMDELTGYTFTKADETYFYPVTDDYFISYMSENTVEEYSLTCYDESGRCVGGYFKVVFQEEVTDDIVDIFQDTLSPYDILSMNAYKNVLYIEAGPGDTCYQYSKEVYMKYVKLYFGSIIVNEGSKQYVK